MGCNVMLLFLKPQTGGGDPRGSGGTAAETKKKYTLKSEGGGTYKVAGGETLNVSMSHSPPL